MRGRLGQRAEREQVLINMTISKIDKLERLLSKHFTVVRINERSDNRPHALKIYPKHGRFSRRDWDKITGIADRYAANVNGVGYIQVSKKCSRSGSGGGR